MVIVVAASLTCWCCALLVTPRRPLPGNAVPELVYTRLLGQRQRLCWLALIVTTIAFLRVILGQPTVLDPDLRDVRLSRAACQRLVRPAVDPLSCYVLEPGGVWAVEEWRDGTWMPIESLPARPHLG